MGVFTATEATGIGALYALFVALGIYRMVSWRDIAQSLWDTMHTSAMLLMIIAAAGVFGHAITLIRLPNAVIEAVTHLGLNQAGFLLVVILAHPISGHVPGNHRHHPDHHADHPPDPDRAGCESGLVRDLG